MIIPPFYPIFLSSPGVGLVSPLTFNKEERRRDKNIYTYFYLLFFVLSKL